MENINSSNLWISRTKKIMFWSAIIAGMISNLGVAIKNDVIWHILPLAIFLSFTIYVTVIETFVLSFILNKGYFDRIKFLAFNFLEWLLIFCASAIFFVFVAALAQVIGWV